MKYIVTINGKNYEVEVEKGEASIVRTTKVADTDNHAESAVTSHGNKEVQEQQKVQFNDAFERLTAPMPGVILDVKITKGTAVKRGQVLFILEAMKMENEIIAPKDGVVTEIVTAKGASVSTGDILAMMQ